MIRINNWQDLHQIQDDPELYREAASTLLYCQYEIQLYGDDEGLDITWPSWSRMNGTMPKRSVPRKRPS